MPPPGTGAADHVVRPLTSRPVHRLPRVSVAGLHDAGDDALALPALRPVTPQGGWMDGLGQPYILSLPGAEFYPAPSLLHVPRLPDPAPLPATLGALDGPLLLGRDGALYPDSFAKSHGVPGVVGRDAEDRWHAHLPEPGPVLPGTWLYAETVFAHFGHTLIDMPSRLWPIGAGIIDAADIDGVLAQGHLGAGPRGQKLPAYALDLLEALWVPRAKLMVTPTPVTVERLLVPRRVAPYLGLWHPVFSRAMRQAGGEIALRPGGVRKIFLSRSRLASDPRHGAGQAALDAVFARRGNAVVHPQEIPFAEQVAYLRGASHIAGTVGSQVHLCAFCDRPWPKVLTIGPSFFELTINARLVEDLGGTETFFEIAAERGPGVRHKTPWSIGPADIARLEARLDAWDE